MEIFWLVPYVAARHDNKNLFLLQIIAWFILLYYIMRTFSTKEVTAMMINVKAK